MALIDARVLRSVKITEAKADKGSVQMSASEEILVLSDTKNPSFSEILGNTTAFDNYGGPLPQIDDQIVVSGKILYVTSRELAYYKENERAVVMTVKYDAKVDDEDGEPPQGIEPSTWLRMTLSSQAITVPAQGWDNLGDVPGLFSADRGRGARNSADDPVDGLEEESSLVRLAYTNTQVANPNFLQLLGHVNSCNSTEFLGAPEYTIRVAGVSADYDQKNNFWSVTVEFVYKWDGWDIRYYDAGFTEKVSVGGGYERRAIVDKAGNPVSTPVPLDGGGQPLNPGDDPVERYLYPYPKTNLAQIFATCNI